MVAAAVDELLQLVERRRPDEAVGLVRGLLDGGLVPDHLIRDILVPVQLEVGRRWMSGEWTIAQEHAATGVVQAALGVLSSQPSGHVHGRQVVVACVEQEWHSLASRLLSEQLRRRGWDPIFLGASTPADDLHGYLADGDVVAAVLSCQLTMSLPGAGRCVRAAHEAGLPVVVGGAAIAGLAGRATALGADAACHDVDDLDVVLRAWSDDPPVDLVDPHDDLQRHLAVLAVIPDVVDAARSMEPVAGLDLRQCADHLAQCLAAAVMLDEVEIVADQVAWLHGVVANRGGGAQAGEVVDALRHALPEDADIARRMLDEATPDR